MASGNREKCSEDFGARAGTRQVLHEDSAASQLPCTMTFLFPNHHARLITTILDTLVTSDAVTPVAAYPQAHFSQPISMFLYKFFRSSQLALSLASAAAVRSSSEYLRRDKAFLSGVVRVRCAITRFSWLSPGRIFNVIPCGAVLHEMHLSSRG